MATLRRTLAATFVALNLAAVLYVNQMPWMIDASGRWKDAAPPAWAARVRRAEWHLRQYAYATGLDSHWKMFGRQNRFNWSYRILALRVDGTDSLLPVPGQSERTFLQRHFVDFREAKFHLNIYARDDLLAAYARHLCRAYPSVGGVPVAAVRIGVEFQDLHDPVGARKARTVVASPPYRAVRQEVPCES